MLSQVTSEEDVHISHFIFTHVKNRFMSFSFVKIEGDILERPIAVIATNENDALIRAIS